ncbi:MFS transporter [Pseudonocardia xinjiangensis]|uniref:MFS transporter n=1 Tax=Pseudonocardia xinjiangensis TaxID=75289 RepID=UPI003D8DE0D8
MVATYREVLSTAVDRRLAVVSLLSKIPFGMFSVSTVLLVSPSYSYGAAGGAVSVMLLANAVSSPLRGNLSRGRSGRAVLLLCLAGYVAGLGGIVLGTTEHLPLTLVLASAVLVGLFLPPISIQLRAHWTAADRARSRPSASAMESALVDFTLITAPALGSWLSVSVMPTVPFTVMGGLMVLSVLLLARAIEVDVPSAHAGHEPARPQSRRTGLFVVFSTLFLFCAALSAIEVALPIYAQQQHTAASSGWYLAGLSLGSIAGALLIGVSSTLAKVSMPMLLGVFASGACLVGLAMVVSSTAVLFACPVAGVAIGTTFSRFYSVIGAATPRGGEVRVQGWANSVTMTGFALGTVASAALAGARGAQALLFLAPAAGAVSAALAFVARRRATTDRHRGR